MENKRSNHKIHFSIFLVDRCGNCLAPYLELRYGSNPS
jgi:hypothetical protein